MHDIRQFVMHEKITSLQLFS